MIEIKSRYYPQQVIFQSSHRTMSKAVSAAIAAGVDLSGVDLRGANLGGTNLWGVDLSCVDLRGVNLSCTKLSGVDLHLDGAPVLPNIHQQVYAAASKPDALDMKSWHGECGTTHCRAGWVVTLAGEKGKALEMKSGTAAAAMAIYVKSDPVRFLTVDAERMPDFYCDNETALADMKRLAEEESLLNKE